MSDLHVESLCYRLEVDERYGRFENPQPLEHETDAYRMWLEDGVLTVEMKEHHATLGLARQRVEDDLRAWELNAALSRDHAWLRFTYDASGARIIDRDPVAPGQCVAAGTATLKASGTVTATGMAEPPVFNEYPRPPAKFAASLDVEAMVRRYERAVWIDNTQMLSFGYACLSWLEGLTGLIGGARDEVVRRYRIDRNVLDMLGDFVSERGDIHTARKLTASATLRPLTPKENAWLRAALKMLIRRKAEYDSDPSTATSLPIIIMKDLPEL